MVAAVRFEDHCSFTLRLLEPANCTRKMGLTPGRNEVLRAVVNGIAKRRETLFDIGLGERDAAQAR